VDACTVAALDVITAFAVPNPNYSSQSWLVFSGLDALQVAPADKSLGLLRIGKFFVHQPFQLSTPFKLNRVLHRCQHETHRLNEISVHRIVEKVVDQWPIQRAEPSCQARNEVITTGGDLKELQLMPR